MAAYGDTTVTIGGIECKKGLVTPSTIECVTEAREEGSIETQVSNKLFVFIMQTSQ